LEFALYQIVSKL